MMHGKAADTTGAFLLIASGLLILRPLARFWSENAPYAYGWGVPFLAAYLLYERWRSRPDPESPSGGGWRLALIAGAWALIFLGTRLVVETEPASRPLLWLDGCLFAGAALAWIGLLGGRGWVRHFAFPVMFLLAAVPWIFEMEWLLIQELMRANAAAVAESLAILGLPARASGNTIVLATGRLDVNEACSGIRSLQASLMLALFFGEFNRYRLAGRIALLAAGTGLALTGNFARLFYLGWQGAERGIAAVEAAHDSAGWLILIFTLAGLWLACLLAPPAGKAGRLAVANPTAAARRRSLVWALAIFAAALGAETVTQGWYAWREWSAPSYPGWAVEWPDGARDFEADRLPESILETLHAAEASGARWRDEAGRQWNGLWIRYRAGAEGKVIFEAHNPALCLPAAGWRPAGNVGTFIIEESGLRLDVQAQTYVSPGGAARVFWIPYLDRGVQAGADREHGLYGHTFAAFVTGRLPWLEDVWTGCRGAQAETIELAVSGASTDAEADAAFRTIAGSLIRPDAPRCGMLVAHALPSRARLSGF